MARHRYFKSSFHVLWSVLLGTTFLSCSFIIYYVLHHDDNTCSIPTGCLSSSFRQSAKLSSESCKSVCTSQECVQIANTIMNNMNQSADPCEDFYTYACGNFHEQYGPQHNMSLMRTLREQMQRIIRDIIETSEETQYPESSAQKLKIVYDSCMDAGSSEVTAIQSLQLFLNQIGIRNWPHLDSNFTFSNPTLEDVLGRLASFGEEIFVKFDLQSDYVDREEDTEGLHNLSVKVPYGIFYSCDDEEVVKSILIDILGLVGMEYDDANNTWDEFMDVDDGFTNLKIYVEETRHCYNKKKQDSEYIECNQENSQNKSMLCAVLDSVVRHGSLSSHVTTAGLLIPCSSAPYMKKLPDFLNRYSHRSLAHYIAVNVLHNNLAYMNFATHKKFRNCVKRPRYTQETYLVELNRWKFCVSWITKYMSLPMGLMYVTELLPQEAVDEIEDLVQNYKNATAKLILAQESMPEDSKTRLAKGIGDVRNDANYVIEVFRNRTFVNIAYKNFHPMKNNFFFNVMHTNRRIFVSTILNNGGGDEMYYSQPFEANAFGGRFIHIMFGLLLPPTYKYGYPKLFNIAQIGSVIGHEIGHALYYNFRGILESEKPTESDNQTRLWYEEIDKCRVEQYFKFELKRIGQNVKGNITNSENFADEVGHEAAEKVAENVIWNMAENMFALPGLPFFPEQLLYIYSSQFFCSVSSIERERKEVEGTHSPRQFRVKGVLQNSGRFSQVFSCPNSTFMNPKKKCSIFL